MNPLINQLATRRKTLQGELDSVVATCEKFNRNPSANELRKFNEIDEEIKALDVHLDQLRTHDERQGVASRAIADMGVRTDVDSKVYNERSGNSYFLDLARVRVNGDYDANERLGRYAQEIRVNPNRTDGTGGFMVPPAWLTDQYVALARAGRPFADHCQKMVLPGGTDSINLPKIATGATVAAQTADAAGVSSTDITDTFVNSPVITLAGQQDIGLQLMEQSPASFDQIVMADLTRALATQVDLQCLLGTGASGQVQGINGLSGTNAVTYTQASPTGPLTYAPIAQAINAVATNLFLPATHLWMHPRRWYWLASQLDSSSRPLVVPYAQQPFNRLGVMDDLAAQGPAGSIAGIDVYLDANIPITQGGGTEDRIYAVRMDQLYLWEGELRTRVLMEVLSGTLQVRVQVYEYMAFIAGRLPKAISVISGTGLAQPSGF